MEHLSLVSIQVIHWQDERFMNMLQRGTPRTSCNFFIFNWYVFSFLFSYPNYPKSSFQNTYSDSQNIQQQNTKKEKQVLSFVYHVLQARHSCKHFTFIIYGLFSRVTISVHRWEDDDVGRFNSLITVTELNPGSLILKPAFSCTKFH